MSELKGTANAPQIYLPEWGHLGNGSQWMRNMDRYLRYEVDLERHKIATYEAVARREARETGKHNVDGLGEFKGCIPARHFFRAMQHYGHDCWSDKTFVKDWYRDNPSNRAQS